MKCLHICNDFYGSAVHKNLYQQLSDHSIEQTIYFPSRSYAMPKASSELSIPNADVIISKPLSKIHRILFRNKINFLFSDLIQKVDVSNHDIVHATTLFSDGAIALKIKKKFNIPYVVTVRSTDVNGFLKYRKDLTFLGLEILKEAEKVIFITPALMQNLSTKPIFRLKKDSFLQKSDVIYNGVDEFWLKDNHPKQNIIPTKILYVGTLIRRKNVLNLCKAVLDLNNNGNNYQLTIVGSGGAFEKEIKNLDLKTRGTIIYKGKITDKNELKKVYRDNHIFALPSKSETFGLVYIEALSQGLPIIYLKNESVDGMFKSNVGNPAVNPNISSLMKSIQKTFDDYSNIDLSEINFEEFSWFDIGKKYNEIYKNCLS